jgi:predicted transcriptional regulator
MALPTVKKSLAELVLKGIITKEGQGKSTGYFVV